MYIKHLALKKVDRLAANESQRENQITVRVRWVRVSRVRVRVYRLIISAGQCQIWLLLQYYNLHGFDYRNKTLPTIAIDSDAGFQ